MSKKLFCIECNPVGLSSNVLDERIHRAIALWEEENPIVGTWWKTRKTNILSAVSFLINILDELVLAVDGFMELSGKDKKATVMSGIEAVYDHIEREIMPLYLRPFSGKIKHVIINVIISYSIDWIVEKYRDGSWRNNGEEISEEGSE
jgi:hypothetical protein